MEGTALDLTNQSFTCTLIFLYCSEYVSILMLTPVMSTAYSAWIFRITPFSKFSIFPTRPCGMCQYESGSGSIMWTRKQAHLEKHCGKTLASPVAPECAPFHPEGVRFAPSSQSQFKKKKKKTYRTYERFLSIPRA